MVELTQGANAPLTGVSVSVAVDWPASATVEADVSAYLLTDAGKVRGDADMLFFNNPLGGDGAVRFAAGGRARGQFEIDLAKVPPAITRIVFCVTIDEAAAGKATLAALAGARITAGDHSYAPALGSATEAAMILGELYLRGGQWKVRAVGQGFDGGLAPLARSFGIDVAEEIAAPSILPTHSDSAKAPDRLVSLEKKVAQDAPRLISLAKTAAVSLRKHRLQDVRAQVALVLDRSGSMWGQYQRGRVQDLLDRIVPLATHFDDDGALDVWAFGSRVQPLLPVTLRTAEGYVARESGGWEKWKVGYGNDEPKVIDAVTQKFNRASPPAYVVFVSDGGVGSDARIERLLRTASAAPIFWQFVGLGGSNYGILQRLDTMTGRTVDNCNFFAIDDLYDVSEAELYNRLLGEFPGWLEAAKAAGVLI